MIRLLFFSIILVFIAHCGNAQATIQKNTCSTIKESTWKSFKRLNFKLEGKDATLTIPNKPLPQNPWVWRARFPNWHTTVDSILLSEGFHIAYINTDNQFGSPKAIATWSNFYEHMTNKFHLSEKVVLEGVSRGGLFVANWAKNNPEKVACIYAEAPVCDFKSWPAGFGEGNGSPNSWITLKEEYGFNSDEEAKIYKDIPIYNLERLAKAKVPIMHMINLKDKVVPPSENTIPFINKYIELGGTATVISCTPGEHKSDGHHFPIENPMQIVNFIKFYSLQNMPINSANYHTVRSGL